MKNVKVEMELLKKFIWESNQKGYGDADQTNRIIQADGSTIITYEDGAWRMVDHYYGGEPYSGMTVVFYNGIACWSMVYHGLVPMGIDKDTVYKTLCPALLAMPQDYPFRGPISFTGETGTYSNMWDGTIEQFAGVEEIYSDGFDDIPKDTLMFHTKYIGGIINRE